MPMMPKGRSVSMVAIMSPVLEPKSALVLVLMACEGMVFPSRVTVTGKLIFFWEGSSPGRTGVSKSLEQAKEVPSKSRQTRAFRCLVSIMQRIL